MELKRLIRLPRERETPSARCAPRPRPRRGARGRPATRCTATHEDASGSSTVDSGPENPAHGWRAAHAIRRSNAAARYVQLTAASRYRRCSPARPTCRAGPTPPAGGSGPEPGPPRHLPSPRVENVRRTWAGSATSHVHSPGTKPVMILCCADRACYDGERHKLIGSADQLC